MHGLSFGQLKNPRVLRVSPKSNTNLPPQGREPLQGEHSSWSEYFDLVKPRLRARAEGFEKIFNHLRHYTDAHELLIVETGSYREENNYEGDGCSSLLFDTFVDYHCGNFFSVDIDPVACNLTKEATKHCQVYCEDSVEFLSNFKDEIDLLYLDSFNIEDWSNDWPAASHHLKELFAAHYCLSPGALVVVDDNIEHPLTRKKIGKGRLVRELIEATNKATLIHDGYQLVYVWAEG